MKGGWEGSPLTAVATAEAGGVFAGQEAEMFQDPATLLESGQWAQFVGNRLSGWAFTFSFCFELQLIGFNLCHKHRFLLPVLKVHFPPNRESALAKPVAAVGAGLAVALSSVAAVLWP